jgi:eukaryotic-like serine/threonine-protein kinase
MRPATLDLPAGPDSARVADFEQAARHRPDADLDEYLPPRSAPAFAPTLLELARVDIELRWSRGTPAPLSDYLDRYPELNAPEALADLAFEEYRVRLRAGQSVRPAEYAERYGVPTAGWPAPNEPPTATDPAMAGLERTVRLPMPPAADSAPQPGGFPAVEPRKSSDDVSGGRAELPRIGDVFLGFHLLEELGRGAFGRVFLARQGDLAGRPVALKIGIRLFSESQTLAQFQHTNIVPIHSLHRARHVQAVCMPYLGRTTLARVLDGIREHRTLPVSGHALLSTLEGQASETLPGLAADERAASKPSCSGPATGPESPVLALLRNLSYPDAVVWLGAQLAAGLAHAHERGIVHQDLKPQNVLVTDDGVPMLLDFSLAADTKRGAGGVGGTLPYMAPEQLAAFELGDGKVDARSDLFALGVLLFELFTGTHPYPEQRGPIREAIARMLAVRRQGPPSSRAINPAVPPSVDALVRKLLAPNPADRYPSARSLQEDLERHLTHQPLRHVRERSVRERARKWAARHPRLSSSTSVAAVAGVLLLAALGSAVYARERNRTYQSEALFRAHTADVRDLQVFLDDRGRSVPRLDEGLARCREVLGRYGVPADRADDAWERSISVRYLSETDRQALRGDVGEVYYLMARIAYVQAVTADPAARSLLAQRAEQWNELGSRYAGDRLPRALAEQRADLAHVRGEVDAEREARQRAASTPPAAARDQYLLGCWYTQLGRYRDALPLLRQATLQDPEHFPAWFVRGIVHLSLEQNEMAALCFGSCVALNKTHAPAWLSRGLAYSRLRFFDQACVDYDRALALDPNLAEAYLQRATAKEALRDFPGAIADLTAALDRGAGGTRVYFVRSHLREKLGDARGAAADRAEGLKLTPADEWSWLARAEHRLDTPKAALADVEEALKIDPTFSLGLQLKAHILSERLNRPKEAVAALDRAVELYPDFVPARAGRGVLLARAGDRVGAIKDAEESLLRDTKGPNLYQVACIYALTSRQVPADRIKAIELLRSGLNTGFGLDLVDADTDLDPIRKDPAFDPVVVAARARLEARAEH